MRWYWAKIAIGALLIFAVGYAGLTAVRGARDRVRHVVTTASDLSLPLPFVPFVLDGTEAGKLHRLVLRRSEPERLSGIDLSVRLADRSALGALEAGCHLTVDNPRNLGRNSSFRCVTMDSLMQPFGEVTVHVRDEAGDWAEAIRVPLVLPRDVIAGLEGAAVAEGVAGAEADDIRALADSIRDVSVRMAEARTEEERRELTDRLRRLRMDLREIERAVSEVSRVRSRVRVTAPGVTVEVNPPKAPEPPLEPQP